MSTTYGFDESGVRRIVKVVRQVENASQSKPGNYEPMVASGTSETWLEAINNAGATIPAYSAVNLTTGTTTNGRKVPYAVKPSTTFYPLWGMTIGRDVDSGGSVGVCCETGLVKYDTGTPATGEGWGPKPSQWTISKGYPGCRIIEVVDSTNKIARVEFLPIVELAGKLDASLSQGSTATVSIWAGDGGSEVDTGWNVTARDWLMKSGATAIASGKKVWLRWYGNAWYVVEAECA